MSTQHDDDEEIDTKGGAKRRFDEFECPECAATNPYSEKFGAGDEITCYYCGEGFKVDVTDEGKLKLKGA